MPSEVHSVAYTPPPQRAEASPVGCINGCVNSATNIVSLTWSISWDKECFLAPIQMEVLFRTPVIPRTGDTIETNQTISSGTVQRQ
jgi:hypothetical protein